MMMRSECLAAILGALACTGVVVPRSLAQVVTPSPRIEHVRNVSRLAGIDQSLMDDRKCGFRWSVALAERARTLDPKTGARITAAIEPAATLSDTVIGFFQIYYDSTGIDAPALVDGSFGRIPGTARAYVDSVGHILNDVWQEEVSRLGFDPPPLKSGAYPIYIREFGGSIYGQTWPDVLPLNPGESLPRYGSYIEIENDFREPAYTERGLNGLRVTAAHEFHHAIQIGAYGLWGSEELWAYELTSTWMESHVYPAILDYVQYLENFFGSPTKVGFSGGLSLGDQSREGYERCVWGQFLERRFGPRIMTGVWQQMRSVRFLAANDRALGLIGSSLASAYGEFSYWNYFTAEHADTIRFYPNGKLLPKYKRLQTIPFSASFAAVNADVSPLSTSMVDFRIGAGTLTFVTSNVDSRSWLAGDAGTRHFEVALSTSKPGLPFQSLGNGLYTGFLTDDHSVWRSFILDSLTGTDAPRRHGDPFPNPMRLQTDDALILPVDAAVGEVGDVLVVTTSFDRVLSGRYPVIAVQGSTGIRIPSQDLRKSASTGIHVVSAQVGGRDVQWKVLLVP